MSRRSQGRPARFRVGRVSVYEHHGAWWLYYRESGTAVRRKAAADTAAAEQVAAQVNAHLTAGAPTPLSFVPVPVAELRQQFLEFHETVARSSLATVARYRTATQHLDNFAARHTRPLNAHEVDAQRFAADLRVASVAPNGHPNSRRRPLRQNGVRFILGVCRSLYAYALKRRYLPPYAGNPFAELPLDRFAAEDAKPVLVFDRAGELAFLRATPGWAFPLHLTLATTGLRVGEAVHLLIEEVDLTGGWLNVRNKPDLGWSVKTRQERSVPLLPEVAAVLRRTVGVRSAGPVFLRPRLTSGAGPALPGGRCGLADALVDRVRAAGPALSRAEAHRLARAVWRDAGALSNDDVRNSFIRAARAAGLAGATCPKSWRHTFATLLQDANVDPLIRQQVLGHRPTDGAGLGMTARYTHTRAGGRHVSRFTVSGCGWVKRIHRFMKRNGTWNESVDRGRAVADA